MSVRIRKSLQVVAIAVPLAFVTGQMPALAATPAPAAGQIVAPADAPPVNPPAAPQTNAAPVANAPQTNPAPVANAPQVQNLGGTPNSPTLGVPALDLKEDIAEICAGDPVLPFKIGNATTLKDLLVKLHLMDALTQVCAVEAQIAATIQKLTGPGGLIDLDALLK